MATLPSATPTPVTCAPASSRPASVRPAAIQRPATAAAQPSDFMRELHGLLAGLSHR